MEKKHNILQSFRQDLSSVSGSRSVATIEKAARGETPHVASPMPAFWALPFFSIIDRLHLPRAPYLSSLSYPARPVPLFRSSQSKYKWYKSIQKTGVNLYVPIHDLPFCFQRKSAVPMKLKSGSITLFFPSNPLSRFHVAVLENPLPSEDESFFPLSSGSCCFAPCILYPRERWFQL